MKTKMFLLREFSISGYFNLYFRGRGLFRHCVYPTRRTGKGDSTREFPLDLYREHFQFAIFGKIQHHFSCNLMIKRANM